MGCPGMRPAGVTLLTSRSFSSAKVAIGTGIFSLSPQLEHFAVLPANVPGAWLLALQCGQSTRMDIQVPPQESIDSTSIVGAQSKSKAAAEFGSINPSLGPLQATGKEASWR